MPQSTVTESNSVTAGSPSPSASKIDAADCSTGSLADSNSSQARRGRRFYRIMTSTAVWILLVLCGVDLLLYFSKPLHNVQIASIVPQDRNPVRVKLEQLALPWCNPDVLVIGSSLSQASFACADALYENRRAPNIGYELYVYGKSRYLESQLLKLTGKKHSVLDLSLGGCMASDAYFMLNKVLSVRSGVKLLILPVAPRDFYDNFSAKDPELSPVGTFLKKKSHESLLSQQGNVQEKTENVLSFVWRYFDIRADYRQMMQLLSCQIFGRAPDLYTSTHFDEPFSKENRVDFNPKPRSAGEVLPDSVKTEDAQRYYKQYNPYTPEKLDVQFRYLEKTFLLCRDHHITPVVIDMPLTQRNLKQLTREMAADYRTKLRALCQKYDVHLDTLQEDVDFTENDFRDSCHLVGSGGKKVIDKLTASLSKDKKVVRGLSR
jgi:hypothetical protein